MFCVPNGMMDLIGNHHTWHTGQNYKLSLLKRNGHPETKQVHVGCKTCAYKDFFRYTRRMKHNLESQRKMQQVQCPQGTRVTLGLQPYSALLLSLEHFHWFFSFSLFLSLFADQCSDEFIFK